MKDKNLAIIPARGGSQRIPGKNIMDFLGKPMIAYSIEAAKNSGIFEEIMVSTDDDMIAEISKKFGANVPFMRSAKNSDHHAVLADVVDEVIGYYKSKDRNFDFVCCILPTAPLIQLKNLLQGYELQKSGKYNSVRPLIKFNYPVQRAFKLKDDGIAEFIYPEYVKSRSQDLEPAYHDAGQFYWMYFEKGMIQENKGGFEISELEAQDIDNKSDIKMAELKYVTLKEKK